MSETMNPDFLKRMQVYLGDEYPLFEKSLEEPLKKSIRLNPKKMDPVRLQQLLGLRIPSPFTSPAFLDPGFGGLYPQHWQGLFYLQEPSASGVVEALHLQGGETVLDLCAAPGSKTTQIYAKLTDGFLVCNEIVPKRARILLSNLERMGAENFCLCQCDPKTLCHSLAECFERILVDAPCSGEGMIKKHEMAAEQWSESLVEACALRQKEILSQAVEALARDGELVYSTCTYAMEENEAIVAWLLESFDDLIQLDCDVPFGRPGFAYPGMDAEKVRRIFPMDGGEGQFLARFKKIGGSKRELPLEKEAKPVKSVKAFLDGQLDTSFNYFRLDQKGKEQKVFAMNHPFIQAPRILRQGLYLGEIVKDRFEPSYAFYLSESMAHAARNLIDCTLEEMDLFCHGRELFKEAPKGYVALGYEGIPFGYGKSGSGRITNKIPKGLRLLENQHFISAQRSEN